MQMTGYTKLFGSIVASTIWREPDTVRIVWITMLAMANKNGVSEASIPGLADLARVSLEKCEEALAALESPDKYSRTEDHEGRRIKKCDGGWLILNHAKYRAKMGVDERREYLRMKQKEHRAKKKSEVSTSVNKRSEKSTPSTQSETDVEPQSEEEGERTRSPKLPPIDAVKSWAKDNGVPDVCAEKFFHECESRPFATSGNWTDAKGVEIANWRAKLRGYATSWVHNDQERKTRNAAKHEDHGEHI